MGVDRRGVEGNVGKICMCGSGRDNNELVKTASAISISDCLVGEKKYVCACRYVCLYDLGLSFGFSHGTESIQFRTLYAVVGLVGWFVYLPVRRG